MTVPPVKRALGPALLFGYCLALMVSVQVAPEGVLERDGYYHARLASLYAEQGLLHRFPWTQLSTWREGFCDKELLYHALMLPAVVAAQEAIHGAQAATVLLDLAIIALVFAILRRWQVPWPSLFTALLLCLGGIFLARFTMIRSHVLSIGLMLAGVHCLARRRPRALLALGFVYAWSYTVPFVLVLTAVPFAAGRMLAGGGLDWRSPVFALAGVLLGLALHPHSPHTMESIFTYIQVVTAGAQGIDASGVELGREIYPLRPGELLRYFPLLIAGMPALCAVAIVHRRRLTPEGAGTLLAAVFWFAMMLRFARFNEYAGPLAVLAAGVVARDLVAGRPAHLQRPSAGQAARGPASLRWLLGCALVLLLAHGLTLHHLSSFLGRGRPPRFRGAAAWMARHLGPSETVLNLFWDEFPELFYFGTRQRYVWGLDPMYTLRHDPGLGRTLEQMRARRVPLDGGLLGRRLGVRYMVLRRQRAGRFPELTGGLYRAVYLDRDAAIFDLAQPASPRGGAAAERPAP